MKETPCEDRRITSDPLMTSHGQSLARQFISAIAKPRFIENHRPEWLYGMELYFFFPDLNVAIEFNGDQHYLPTDFGPHDDQKRRDKRKKELCLQRGVKIQVWEAIDLQVRVARSKLKSLMGDSNLTKEHPHDLTREATKYREVLREKYGSHTCRARSGKARKQAIEDNLKKVISTHPNEAMRDSAARQLQLNRERRIRKAIRKDPNGKYWKTLTKEEREAAKEVLRNRNVPYPTPR